MNWFRRLFGFISTFFVAAAKTTIGLAAEELSETALRVVRQIDKLEGLSGQDKHARAVILIQQEYSKAPSVAINLAIEAAVAITKDLLNDKD